MLLFHLNTQKMELTEEDIEICKLLFNEETHQLAIELYQERAKVIFEFVNSEISKI